MSSLAFRYVAFTGESRDTSPKIDEEEASTQRADAVELGGCLRTLLAARLKPEAAGVLISSTGNDVVEKGRYKTVRGAEGKRGEEGVNGRSVWQDVSTKKPSDRETRLQNARDGKRAMNASKHRGKKRSDAHLQITPTPANNFLPPQVHIPPHFPDVQPYVPLREPYVGRNSDSRMEFEEALTRTRSRSRSRSRSFFTLSGRLKTRQQPGYLQATAGGAGQTGQNSGGLLEDLVGAAILRVGGPRGLDFERRAPTTATGASFPTWSRDYTGVFSVGQECEAKDAVATLRSDSMMRLRTHAHVRPAQCQCRVPHDTANRDPIAPDARVQTHPHIAFISVPTHLGVTFVDTGAHSHIAVIDTRVHLQVAFVGIASALPHPNLGFDHITSMLSLNPPSTTLTTLPSGSSSGFAYRQACSCRPDQPFSRYQFASSKAVISQDQIKGSPVECHANGGCKGMARRSGMHRHTVRKSGMHSHTGTAAVQSSERPGTSGGNRKITPYGSFEEAHHYLASLCFANHTACKTHNGSRVLGPYLVQGDTGLTQEEIDEQSDGEPWCKGLSLLHCIALGVEYVPDDDEDE
ncbi:hypothetical protein B0H16DRAFT_1477205 [Mycena metata]|uniref:Uncharacterized protein n=1 Tax=Mycena metata TaxID=1033252 RepID=A0AAD7MG35_9AGAR|nr:hypothetical protein B0H16DRAFT_1477205 [Mycena metata]